MTQPQPADAIYAIARVNESLYLACHSGLYSTSLGGEARQNLYESWLPEPTMPTPTVAAVDGILLAGISGGVVCFEDGGKSRAVHAFRSPPPLVACLAASPSFSDDGIVFAGSYEDGLFRSMDRGKSWQAANFGLFDHHILCLALSPQFAADGRAFVGTGSGIYHSENGGRLWHDIALPRDDAVLGIALSPGFATDSTLFVGTESSGLLKSDDGGGTWTACYRTGGAVNSVLVTANRQMIALVDDAVVHSVDGGASWHAAVAAGVQAMSLEARGDALLLGMADGSIQRKRL